MTTNVKNRSPDSEPRGVAAGRVAGPPAPVPEHKILNSFIGKWITEGQTLASADAQAAEILASDVYEWVPGGFFVVHSPYGRNGEVDAGGVKIISYAEASKNHPSWFLRIPNIRAHSF